MKHLFIIIIVPLTVFSCRHQKQQVNSLNDIKGIWVIDSIEYHQDGLTKKMDLSDRLYFTEFNDFGEVVLFDKREILFVGGDVKVIKGANKYKTLRRDYLYKVVYPVLQVADWGDSSGKFYKIKQFSNSHMQIEYNTVARSEKSKFYLNGKLSAMYYKFKYSNDSTEKYKVENKTYYELVTDGWANINYLDYELSKAIVVVYYSKYKNQNIKNDLFNTPINNKIDTPNVKNRFNSEHYYSIEIPKGFCQISEANKKIITDSLLSLQNKKSAKLITDAIFITCDNNDEFPRFSLTFLPVENYESVTFKQGISAIINVNLATEFEKLKSRFNFIDSLSVKNPAVDYNKQAFLFSSSGQIFGQSPKYLYSATILCKKGLITIGFYCRYPEQLESARKIFYSIYNSFQIDPNYRLND